MKYYAPRGWKEIASEIASGILMLIFLVIAVFFCAAFQP